MREIKVSEVTDVIAKLCMDSCYYLPQEAKRTKSSIPS